MGTPQHWGTQVGDSMVSQARGCACVSALRVVTTTPWFFSRQHSPCRAGGPSGLAASSRMGTGGLASLCGKTFRPRRCAGDAGDREGSQQRGAAQAPDSTGAGDTLTLDGRLAALAHQLEGGCEGLRLALQEPALLVGPPTPSRASGPHPGPHLPSLLAPFWVLAAPRTAQETRQGRVSVEAA